METNNSFDVIIIGGSFAGLSAAMALGRSLRKVLIIDSGKPCNIQTPHAHNFITHDGETPASIAASALNQVLKYPTISLKNGLAVKADKTENGFEIGTEINERFFAKKLIFATGMKDIMPDIKGFGQCWGISVLHCPYCHGYEVRNEETGILANGEIAFEFAKMISHWTNKLTIYTNGKALITDEQVQKLQSKGIAIVEDEIAELEHEGGYVNKMIFVNGKHTAIKVLYAKLEMIQHCDLPKTLGCKFTEMGFLEVDGFQQTTVQGVYAAGDNTTMFRALPIAIASGTKAGATLNKEMIYEEF